MNEDRIRSIQAELRDIHDEAEAAAAELARPGRPEASLTRITEIVRNAAMTDNANHSLALGRITEQIYLHNRPSLVLTRRRELQKKLEQLISQAAPPPAV
jgi:hypothetical protein